MHCNVDRKVLGFAPDSRHQGLRSHKSDSKLMRHPDRRRDNRPCVSLARRSTDIGHDHRPVRTRSVNRTIPLILAVALFMENMDSTVIATSLPAIANDIGTSPIALKLALTSYLVSLAIFIPISGWMADRFGAKRVFRAAIGVFIVGSIACAMSDSLLAFVLSRFLQGMGGAMMTPVARLVLVRATPKRELVVGDGLADRSGAGRAAGRPAGRRLHHHLFHLALDLPDQRADRAHRHLARHALPARHRSRSRRRRSTSPASCCRRSPPPAWCSACRWSACRRCRRSSASSPLVVGVVVGRALSPACAARRTIRCSTCELFRNPVFRAAIIGGTLFRIGNGAVPFLLPLMFQLGFGLTPFQSGMMTFASAHRRDRHEVPRAADSCGSAASATC